MSINIQTKELSEYLANQLLDLGSDEYLGQCNRVQFMIGIYPYEVSGGGMRKEALTRYFEKILNSYFTRRISVDKVFEVKRQHCTCHPETCGHFPFIIELNGKVIGSYSTKDKAEDVVKILSEAVNKGE